VRAGVVGPDFDFNVETPVLSHDFTHKTHARVFGFHYPPTLPDWCVRVGGARERGNH